MNRHIGIKHLGHNTARRLVSATAVTLLFASTPVMASHIQTPAELRTACENSSGNIVTLDHSTTIIGADGASLLPVISGCTIVLRPGATLSTEFVRMSFAGPLVIQSADPTVLNLVKTHLSAPSLSVMFTGLDSTIASTESALDATAGDLTIAMSARAKIEMVKELPSGPAYGLAATGMVQITTRSGFQGLIYEKNIYAGQGFRFAQTILGDASALTLGKVILDAPQGGVSITGQAGNNKLEISESHLRVRDGIRLELDGRWSFIGLKQVAMGGWNGVTASGGVIIGAATTSPEGTVSLSEVSIFDVATATVRASALGSVTPTAPRFGVIVVEKSNILPDFDLRIETGRDSKIEVKENNLASDTMIRIATGTGASTCLQESNSISGPPQVLQLCP